MYKYFFFLLSIILIGCNSGDSYFKRIVVDVKKDPGKREVYTLRDKPAV